MFARERQSHIAWLVEEFGRIEVQDMAQRFGVSGVTIRKDLLALEESGRVIRTHGGAVVPERSRPERAFEVRERLQRAEKEAIGRAAAELVREGDSIALDASTTALYLAHTLKARGGWNQLTVITTGIRIASELAGHPGITVAMAGGWVRWEALSLVGGLGDAVFERVNVQTAFVGAAGFTLDTGLSDATEDEALTKRSMVSAARDVVAVVDHTKWGRPSFATFCTMDQITHVISGDAAPRDIVNALKARQIDTRLVAVHVPGEAGKDSAPKQAKGRVDGVGAQRERETVNAAGRSRPRGASDYGDLTCRARRRSRSPGR